MSYRSYVCLARSAGKVRYFLWQSDLETNRVDRVLLGPGDCIASFATEREARARAHARGERAELQPPVIYDLDGLAAWCEHPAEATLDCEAALNAWNLFNDLGVATTDAQNLYSFAERGINSVYDKLFFGNNLPAMTPIGESFTPVWSGKELARLSQALRLGLSEFVSRLSSTDIRTSGSD